MSLGIPTCSADDDPDAMYAKLDAAGCLVVHDTASSDQVAAVRAELVDHMASARVADDKPTAFYPGITRRVVALMHRSPTVRELMMHPITEALGDRHLGQNCSKWTLNVTAALEVGPGARDQILHREEDLYPYFPLPRPNLILASMWAMSDFTADNGGTQRLITNAREDPDGRDINGQVCFTDDGRFIAGEDTGQPEIPAGFGIFDLDGDSLGTLSATQIGKLTPDFEAADNQPEPYGCAFLPDGRLVTTDVGNQASGPGTGQLTVWFPPYDGARCVVADYIATAQQLAADGDDVLVASARPPTIGVQRFSNLPRTAEECNPDAVTVELFIGVGDGVSLTTGITADRQGGWYVSDTLTGVINQYDGDGNYLRTVLAPPEGEGLGLEPISTGSPLGIAVGLDGTLYYADLALALNDGGIGPTGGQGTVRRIRFDTDNQPLPPETIDYGLNFPDGLGVLPVG